MSQPDIQQYRLQSAAYIKAVQLIQQALVADEQLAVTVEPYDGGWRVITFAHEGVAA